MPVKVKKTGHCDEDAISRLAERLDNAGGNAGITSERLVRFLCEAVTRGSSDMKEVEAKVAEIEAFVKSIPPHSASAFFAKAYYHPEVLVDSRVLSPSTADFIKRLGSDLAAGLKAGDYLQVLATTKAINALTSDEFFSRSEEIRIMSKDSAFNLFMETAKKGAHPKPAVPARADQRSSAF